MATIYCPYITNVSISVKGGGFALYSVKWAFIPLGNQVILVQYRVTGDVTWIDASTNEPVDIYGNLVNKSLTILSSAVEGESYQVRLVNQCGSIEYIQPFTYSSKVYGNSYLVDNALYNICGNDPVRLYSSQPFSVGMIVYEDAGLTTPLEGYSYIDYNGESIFTLSPSTGEVGAITAYSCVLYSFNGAVGNDAGTICGNTLIPIYTSSQSPSIGDFMYLDAALSVPVTGYDFILFEGDKAIYNIDSSTGEVLSLQGDECSGYGGYYQVSKVKEDLFTKEATLLFCSTPFGKGAEMKTDSSLSTVATGYNYISQQFNTEIHDISITTGVVGCVTTPC